MAIDYSLESKVERLKDSLDYILLSELEEKFERLNEIYKGSPWSFKLLVTKFMELHVVMKQDIREGDDQTVYVRVSDLINRFDEINKLYQDSPWNYKQVKCNIEMVPTITKEDLA